MQISKILFFLSFYFFSNIYYADENTLISEELPEMVIGTASIKPGIDLVFEGAIKDDVQPEGYFLKESETDIHIEVLVNWNENAPPGSPVGGFIPYLNVSAKITNQKTEKSSNILLSPHLNMSDNYHYAQNIKLPGYKEDLYTVEFNITPPSSEIIGLHYDWRETVGNIIVESKNFIFPDLNFAKIASASRR